MPPGGGSGGRGGRGAGAAPGGAPGGRGAPSTQDNKPRVGFRGTAGKLGRGSRSQLPACSLGCPQGAKGSRGVASSGGPALGSAGHQGAGAAPAPPRLCPTALPCSCRRVGHCAAPCCCQRLYQPAGWSLSCAVQRMPRRGYASGERLRVAACLRRSFEALSLLQLGLRVPAICTLGHMGSLQLRSTAANAASPTPSPSPFATALRRWEAGHCRFGDRCNFAHGDEELRALPPRGGGRGRGGRGSGEGGYRDDGGGRGGGRGQVRKLMCIVQLLQAVAGFAATLATSAR